MGIEIKRKRNIVKTAEKKQFPSHNRTWRTTTAEMLRNIEVARGNNLPAGNVSSAQNKNQQLLMKESSQIKQRGQAYLVCPFCFCTYKARRELFFTWLGFHAISAKLPFVRCEILLSHSISFDALAFKRELEVFVLHKA